MNQQPSRLTPLGRLISLLMVAGLIAFGVYLVSDRFTRGGGGSTTPGGSGGEGGEGPAVTEYQAEVPRLSPPAPFTM
jgi:hypothetical protein